MKYKMLRDTPMGKAGSVWKDFSGQIKNNHEIELMAYAGEGLEFWKFPRSTFSEWFEEIKPEMQKFTKEQRQAIFSQLYKLSGRPSAGDEFDHWLDANTES